MTQLQFKRIPFDLELAKKITNKEVNGRIVDGNGKELRIIYFDKMGTYPIVALAKMPDGEEDVCTYTVNGQDSVLSFKSKLNLHIEIPTYYRDYSNFVPQKWQPCLVRDNQEEQWEISVCAGRNSVGNATFYHRGCTYSHQHCLPLSKVTERLVDTKKSYEELIQELDAESTKNEQL